MSAHLMFMITVFGGLAFTLATLVLYTLAHQYGSAINRHELIRAARMRQHAYLESLAERRRGVNADYGVDVVEDDEINVDILGEVNPDSASDAPAARLAA